MRAVRTRELTRAAMSVRPAGRPRPGYAIADATDAALLGRSRCRARRKPSGEACAPTSPSVMGHTAGASAPMHSDADVIALHEPVGGASDSEARPAPLIN